MQTEKSLSYIGRIALLLFFIDISFYFCLSIVIDEKKLDLFTLDLQKTAPFTIVLMQLPCN